MIAVRILAAIVASALCALLTWHVVTEKPFRVEAPSELGAYVDVINADTLRFEHANLLIRGVDGPDAQPSPGCPEEAVAAPLARAYVRARIRGRTLTVGDNIGGAGNRREGDVFVNGQSLADILVDECVAVPSPRNARNWCQDVARVQQSNPNCQP